jgi:DNA-binding XRE family transcriptional regulator
MRKQKRNMDFDPIKKKELDLMIRRGTKKEQGKIIQLVRETFKMNKEAFAQLVGVTATTIGRWEKYDDSNTFTFTTEQLANFNQLLRDLHYNVYDLKLDFDVLVSGQDLKTIGLFHWASEGL